MSNAHPYRKEISSLLSTLREHHLDPVAVHSEGDTEPVDGIDAAIEAILATDESVLDVVAGDGRILALYLVLGNSPGEVVADYSVDPLIDQIVDDHFELRFTF